MTETLTLSALATGTAMMGRRTVKQFLPQPVARATLEQLIELAVWAPNHRLNEPWRLLCAGRWRTHRIGADCRGDYRT